MAMEGAEVGGNDSEDVDVAAVASRLVNALVAQQGEEQEVKKRVVQSSERTMVQEDGVLKERVRNQEKARTAWEQRWKMVALREKMFRKEMAEIGVDPRPPSLRPCPVSLPDTKALQSPAVPTLSSGIIGWRSTERQFSLELFGPLYISPVHTIEPPAQDGDPPRDKQFFIRLGYKVAPNNDFEARAKIYKFASGRKVVSSAVLTIGYVYSPDKSARRHARIYKGNLNDLKATKTRRQVNSFILEDI